MISENLQQTVPKILDIVSKQVRFDDLHIEIHQPVGDLDTELKVILKRLIGELIQNDPSHLVTGSYCIDNIDTRPDNSMIIIGEKKILLNVSKSEVLIIESGATENELLLVKELLIQLPQVFVFVSGSNLIEIVSELNYDRRSDNIVFQLNRSLFNEIPEPEYSFDIKNLIPNSDLSKEDRYWLEKIWDYNTDEIENLSLPHVVAVREDEVLGGARANALTDNYAVIGGVKTLSKYRGQGVGYKVSYFITNLLIEKKAQVVLETDDENIPAVKIYEKLGYERVGYSLFLDLGTDMIEKIRGDRDY